jgi:hypothetical protein
MTKNNKDTHKKGGKKKGKHEAPEPGLTAEEVGHAFEEMEHHYEMRMEQAMIAGDEENIEHMEEVLHHMEEGVSELRGIAMPRGLHQVPLLSETEKKDMNITETESRIMNGLLGLPGRLNLTRMTTEKYFGDDGRMRLFDRNRWLTRHAHIAATSSNTISNDMTSFIFNNERDDRGAMAGLDFPFSPIRPEHKHRNIAGKVIAMSCCV